MRRWPLSRSGMLDFSEMSDLSAMNDEELSRVVLRWVGSDHWMALCVGLLAGVLFGVMTVAELLKGSLLLPAVTTYFVVLSGHVVWRAGQSLRAGPPALGLLRSGGVRVHHPMLVEPMLIPAEDVHSIWLGPFEQPPATKRDRWTGRRVFPADVMDLSARGIRPARTESIIIVALSRAQRFQPRLRISPWMWLFLSTPSNLPFLSGRDVHGVVGEVAGPDAKTATAGLPGRAIRDGSTMPDDVRRWLT